MSAFSQLQGISLASDVPAAAKRGASSPDELGQKDFLRLLTAQMENQDPTKPMDNFQFLSQIAQFGMVEGIGSVDRSIGAMTDNYRQGQLLQASSLLDREVLSDGNAFNYRGDGARGVVSAPEGASGVVVDVRTGEGMLVDRIELGAVGTAGREFAWQGVFANGSVAPDGTYTFHARGIVDGELREINASAFNRVESVTVDDASLIDLVLDTGEELGLSAVREIR